jgi:hypothetical protein
LSGWLRRLKTARRKSAAEREKRGKTGNLRARRKTLGAFQRARSAHPEQMAQDQAQVARRPPEQPPLVNLLSSQPGATSTACLAPLSERPFDQFASLPSLRCFSGKRSRIRVKLE